MAQSPSACVSMMEIPSCAKPKPNHYLLSAVDVRNLVVIYALLPLEFRFQEVWSEDLFRLFQAWETCVFQNWLRYGSPVCLLMSLAFGLLGYYIDIGAYGLFLIMSPLAITLLLFMGRKVLFEDAVGRMLKLLNADLDRNSNELIECEEAQEMANAFIQLLITALTNMSILSTALQSSRIFLLSAAVISPLLAYSAWLISCHRRINVRARIVWRT